MALQRFLPCHPQKKNDMLKSWLIIGLASALLIGCAESSSDGEKQGESDEVQVVEETKTEEAAGENEPFTFTTTKPGEAVPQPVNNTQPTAGLNPAHGEPGHDCAIPVGAPLDGSGGQTQPSTPPIGAQPVAQPQPNLQSGAPANGLNPAHGQPGHDCAVAVGAPLPAK